MDKKQEFYKETGELMKDVKKIMQSAIENNSGNWRFQQLPYVCETCQGHYYLQDYRDEHHIITILKCPCTYLHMKIIINNLSVIPKDIENKEKK